MSRVQPREVAGDVRRRRRGAVPDRRRRRRHVGLYALMATSFFMSIQFPTIFTMSLRGLGTLHEVGLVVPGHGDRRRRGDSAASWGWCPTRASINLAMLVPAACFAVVFLFAWKSRRDSRSTATRMTRRAPRAGQHRARSQRAGFRRRRHRQPVSRARRRGRARRGARVVRRRRSLLRHRAVLWFRA